MLAALRTSLTVLSIRTCTVKLSMDAKYILRLHPPWQALSHVHSLNNREPRDHEECDEDKDWQQPQGALLGIVVPQDEGADETKQQEGRQGG